MFGALHSAYATARRHTHRDSPGGSMRRDLRRLHFGHTMRRSDVLVAIDVAPSLLPLSLNTLVYCTRRLYGSWCRMIRRWPESRLRCITSGRFVTRAQRLMLWPPVEYSYSRTFSKSNTHFWKVVSLFMGDSDPI